MSKENANEVIVSDETIKEMKDKHLSSIKTSLPKTKLEFQILLYRDMAIKSDGIERVRALQVLDALLDRYYK